MESESRGNSVDHSDSANIEGQYMTDNEVSYYCEVVTHELAEYKELKTKLSVTVLNMCSIETLFMNSSSGLIAVFFWFINYYLACQCS